MSSGRTIWWAKDSAWWRRERIVELGEEFGPAGPAVIDWLSCEAKVQNAGGSVKAGLRSTARGCFINDPDVVSHVLSRSVTLGLLHDLEVTNGLFTCRISGWKADQERVQAAQRQAAKRARDKAEMADGDGESGDEPSKPRRRKSRPVTPSHKKSPKQDRTEEGVNPPNPPLRGGSLMGGRRRDRDQQKAELEAWAVELVEALGGEATRQRVGEAVVAVTTEQMVHGEATTVEQVLARLRRLQPSWPLETRATA